MVTDIKDSQYEIYSESIVFSIFQTENLDKMLTEIIL